MLHEKLLDIVLRAVRFYRIHTVNARFHYAGHRPDCVAHFPKIPLAEAEQKLIDQRHAHGDRHDDDTGLWIDIDHVPTSQKQKKQVCRQHGHRMHNGGRRGDVVAED